MDSLYGLIHTYLADCEKKSLNRLLFGPAEQQASPLQRIWRMANVQVPVVAIGAFGDSPVQMTCPNCHQTMVTKVDFSSGVLTYLFCGGLFFCGFVLGCCLIPFCFDRLKDAKHMCPSCKTILGVYKRL